MAGDTRRLGPINGYRGIAILMVIFHHFAGHHFKAGWHALKLGKLPVPLFTVLSNSAQGVRLFFILSGFVLFLPYALGKRKIESKADVSEFYRRRAHRLLPLYYLNVVIAMIFYHHLRDQPLQAVAQFGLMATALFPFSPMFYPSFNWVLWSFGVELWFSALFPALIVARKRLGMRTLLLAALAISLVTQLVACAMPQYDYVVRDGLFGRLGDFLVGMLLAELYCSDVLAKSRAFSPIGGVVGLLLTLFSFGLSDLCIMGAFSKFVGPFAGLLSNLGILLLVGSSLRNDLLARLTSPRPLQILGMMCFSLYVWHGIAMVAIFGPDYIQAYPAQLVVTYFVLVALISTLTFRYVEFGHVRTWREVFKTAA